LIPGSSAPRNGNGLEGLDLKEKNFRWRWQMKIMESPPEKAFLKA
jgi:hypothetical protein